MDLNRFFAGAGIQYSWDDLWAKGVNLSLGLDLDRQDDERRRFDNLQGQLGGMTLDQRELVTSIGGFAQLQYDLPGAWFLQGGLRFDRIEFDVSDSFLADGDDSGVLDFNEISPSIGVGYAFAETHQAFAAVSTSFETPTTTELANPDGGGGFNQGLDSQTAVNYELGIKGSNRGMGYEFALFHIDLEDELIPFELASMPGRTFFSNAGASRRTGVELGLNWRSQKGIFAALSYTYSDFEFQDFLDDNGNDFSGNHLPGLPKHFGQISFGYADDKVDFTFETLYAGSLFANNANNVRVESFAVANLRFSYTFTTGQWRLQPYAGVNNMFNELYNQNIRINAFGGRFFEPAPERNLYLGMRVNYRLGNKP